MKGVAVSGNYNAPLLGVYKANHFDMECADCQAAPGVYCRNTISDLPKKIPCTARMLGLTREEFLARQPKKKDDGG